MSTSVLALRGAITLERDEREHLLERVFERFWQVGAHDHRGMGLGLYISRSLIEAHGGEAAIRSRGGSSYTPIPGEDVRLIAGSA